MMLKLVMAFFFLVHSVDGAELADSSDRLAQFLDRYWKGQFNTADVKVIHGGTSRFTLEFLKPKTLTIGSVAIFVNKRSRVVFDQGMILTVEAITKKCQVGMIEALEGTTIDFWEADHNLINAIVTSKPIRLRGHTWPAKSKLLFYIDDKINPMLYAVVLGEDLKGTPYKAGQKVYIGTLEDPDAQKTGPLSLTGRDPTL